MRPGQLFDALAPLLIHTLNRGANALTESH